MPLTPSAGITASPVSCVLSCASAVSGAVFTIFSRSAPTRRISPVFTAVLAFTFSTSLLPARIFKSPRARRCAGSCV